MSGHPIGCDKCNYHNQSGTGIRLTPGTDIALVVAVRLTISTPGRFSHAAFWSALSRCPLSPVPKASHRLSFASAIDGRG